MAMDVKLKPGWLSRDISKASERADERDALRARVFNRSSDRESSAQGRNGQQKDSHDPKRR